MIEELYVLKQQAGVNRAALGHDSTRIRRQRLGTCSTLKKSWLQFVLWQLQVSLNCPWVYNLMRLHDSRQRCYLSLEWQSLDSLYGEFTQSSPSPVHDEHFTIQLREILWGHPLLQNDTGNRWLLYSAGEWQLRMLTSRKISVDAFNSLLYGACALGRQYIYEKVWNASITTSSLLPSLWWLYDTKGIPQT